MNGETIYASPDAFGRFRVKEMGESDFWLGSATPTALKSPKCHILLFYEPVSTDQGLLQIWRDLAATIGGPVIGAVNTSAKGEVMDAFMAVNADVDNPLNDYSGFGVPTILVYRNRWPQAFYNGELSYNALKNWILVLACKPGYRERNSNFHGVGSIGDDAYVTDSRIENYAFPTSSSDFTSGLGEGTRGTVEGEQGGQEQGYDQGQEQDYQEQGQDQMQNQGQTQNQGQQRNNPYAQNTYNQQMSSQLSNNSSRFSMSSGSNDVGFIRN